MKKWIGILVFIVAAVLLWHFILPVKKDAIQVSQNIKNFASSTLPTIESITGQISSPPPLTSSAQNANAALTDPGVISWTNINRKQNGNLPALVENSILDKEAAAKLADMFKQQYFEHVNPQGHGPDYLAQTYGYAYASIGENLALGNFKDDQDLLTAWMNSPGHRANILNVKYQQIGAAVGQGIYQGQKTWLAVQEFGQPASACPSIDSNLKAEINSLQQQVSQQQAQLTAEKSQIDSANPQTQADYDAYNQEVSDYNSQIAIYNNKVDQLKLDTGQYNAQVAAYNACV
jgi:uncharacterized protein YkwD